MSDNTDTEKKKKTFVLTDESLNSSGFWLLTEGGDLGQFEKNPLMLWMHMRAWRGTKDEVLPIGSWVNVQKKNGQILAEPNFDEDDEFAMKIKGKVDKDILRMSSVGIRVIEISEDKKYLKPGQTRATVTKWKLVEASICDIGRNENALAFYDENDNLLTFSEDGTGECPVKLLNLTENDSKSTNMNEEVKKLLNLSEGAGETEILSAVKTLSEEVKELKADKEARELKLKAEQKTEAETLLKQAFRDGRLNDDEKHSVRGTWEKFFDTDHEGAKHALSAIPKPKSARQIVAEGDETFSAGSAWQKRMEEIDKQSKR